MSLLEEAGFNFYNSYRKLPSFFYSNVDNADPIRPQLRILNEDLAKVLELDIQYLKKQEIISILSGNYKETSLTPIAQAYAGHQFGNFTMLGDGRAMLLGEHVTHNNERYDIQLKGSGKTTFSRGGDGKATLGSMLREYIISEAIHALHIPTTRSLAVVTTGEEVRREVEMVGAVLTRIASSHIRVGTFQYARSFGGIQELQVLADYTIERHYPTLLKEPDRYLQLLKQVVKKQAQTIAKWQLVGFIHGVMNTDNMTISGETIDYGPCAFMDEYNPKTVFSSIDHTGRYAYGNQPNMGGWNVARFAETLLPLIDENEEQALELAQKAISEFPDHFHEEWLGGMRKKLGLQTEEDEDATLIRELLELMHEYQADYTNTFVALTMDDRTSMVLFQIEAFQQWYKKWQERMTRQQLRVDAVKEMMKQHNPAIIPRNHHVEDAITAAVSHHDDKPLRDLLAVITKPFAHTTDQKEYASLPPKALRPQHTYCGT